MNMSEMGEVYAYLLRYRMAESRPANRNRRPSRAGLISERDVCALLAESSEEELSQLRQFLSGQGLQLTILDATDYPGIAAGSQMFVLQRLPDADLPALFSQQPVYQALRLRQETQEEVALWFMHLWLLLMGLLYTRNNRSLTDVSLYQEAVLSPQELIAAMRQHIEQLRQSGTHTEAMSVVVKALADEKGDDVPRRVRAFIELLEAAGHLHRISDKNGDKTTDQHSNDDDLPTGNSYQQTLLGALEAEQIGVHHIHHLLNDLSLPEDNTRDSEHPDKGLSEKEPSEKESPENGSDSPASDDLTESKPAPTVDFADGLFPSGEH